jgi:hypothetical protein
VSLESTGFGGGGGGGRAVRASLATVVYGGGARRERVRKERNKEAETNVTETREK